MGYNAYTAFVSSFSTTNVTFGGHIDATPYRSIQSHADNTRISLSRVADKSRLQSTLYAENSGEVGKRKIFSSRKKKRSTKRTKKSVKEEKSDTAEESTVSPEEPSEDETRDVADTSQSDSKDNVYALFVTADQQDQLPSLGIPEAGQNKGAEADKEFDSGDADAPSETKEQADELPDEAENEDDKVEISKRRLHFLETLFSDQQQLNARQIVSLFYHLLGSVNNELIGMFGNLTDEEPRSTHDGAASSENAKDGEVGPSSKASTDDQDNPLSADGENPPTETTEEAMYDKLKWPFEMTGEGAEGSSDKDDAYVEETHWGEYLSKDSTLTSREVRQLKHLQMLTRHEKDKLLKHTDHSKSVSALFIPSQPITIEEHNEQSSNEEAVTSKALGGDEGSPVDTVIEKVGEREVETASNVPFTVDDTQYEPFLVDYSEPSKNSGANTVDRFIVSIPKSTRAMNNKTDVKLAKDGETIDFDIPVTMFSLNRGFLGTLYNKYLRPSLISSIEAAFNVKLRAPCGIMDLKRLDLNVIANPNPDDLAIDRDELRKYLRNVVLHSRLDQGERDIIEYEGVSTELSQKTRQKVAMLLKWMKDEVFLRGCITLLTTLLGRHPTIEELAFSLGHDDPQRLDQALDICASYTQNAFDGLTIPISELIILKLEKDWGIERKHKGKDLVIIDPHMSRTQGIVDSFLWRRMCSIHLNTLTSMGSKTLSQLYGSALSTAKNDVLKARLPEHMPMGKYRLAHRAKRVQQDLIALRDRVIAEIQMSIKNGLEWPDRFYKDDPFVQRVIAIERAYFNYADDAIKNSAREMEHERILREEMESRINASWENISEALEGLNVYEIGTAGMNIRDERPNPYPGSQKSNRKRDPTYSQLESDDEDDDDAIVPWTKEYMRDTVLRKSLRMLANEALDDRVARFLFMARLELFTHGSWNDEEIAQTLGLSSTEILNFIFYAAKAHCQEYEVWRIKLKLPPYVDETKSCPGLLSSLNIKPNLMPHHVEAALEKSRKISSEGSKSTSGSSVQTLYPLRPSMKDRYKRLRAIKPRMGSMKDSLLNQSKTLDQMQKTMMKSPLYYLLDSFKET
ncbi:hypothetical protein BgAZ_203970 [Babesia gibsoni]|uniref:Uncharacterized protein n=1 Tax=Babesia gibsoni TaxID=33632 RepID=A0AAD8PE91_BABGI|nr:hypothetical protein BgAZ_203970 [Babesia gibsoni]